jgi:hypothetical protein
VRELFLFPDPRNVFSDGFMGEKQLFGMVFVSKFLLVGYEVMDASVTVFAEHKAALVHFLLAKAISVAFFSMHPSGNQMMLRQAFVTTA